MRLLFRLSLLSLTVISGCAKHCGSNPDDPYEPVNRKIHDFNMAFDATMLKPVAKIYRAVLPGPVRVGVNNALNNFQMLPTLANDLLQGDFRSALKDTWRVGINTTFGVVGVFDAAAHWGLPPHYNDFGLTLAKWGDKKSPYIVLPLLGPSTVRDGVGFLYDFTLFTPYPYIGVDNNALMYSLVALRFVDLRAQLLENEGMMQQAIDQYSLIRDAYLQHRNYLISGKQQAAGSLYVDDSAPSDYVEDEDSPVSDSKPQ